MMSPSSRTMEIWPMSSTTACGPIVRGPTRAAAASCFHISWYTRPRRVCRLPVEMALVAADGDGVVSESVTAGTEQAPMLACGTVVVVDELPPPPPPHAAATSAMAMPAASRLRERTDEHPHDHDDNGADHVVPEEFDPGILKRDEQHGRHP